VEKKGWEPRVCRVWAQDSRKNWGRMGKKKKFGWDRKEGTGIGWPTFSWKAKEKAKGCKSKNPRGDKRSWQNEIPVTFWEPPTGPANGKVRGIRKRRKKRNPEKKALQEKDRRLFDTQWEKNAGKGKGERYRAGEFCEKGEGLPLPEVGDAEIRASQ